MKINCWNSNTPIAATALGIIKDPETFEIYNGFTKLSYITFQIPTDCNNIIKYITNNSFGKVLKDYTEWIDLSKVNNSFKGKNVIFMLFYQTSNNNNFLGYNKGEFQMFVREFGDTNGLNRNGISNGTVKYIDLDF